MRHTLFGFYGSITNASVYAQVNGVQDQSQTLDSGNRLQVRNNAEILAAYVMGINLTAARFNSPSLRGFVMPQVYPCNPTADVRTTDKPMLSKGRWPRLQQWEGLSLEVSRGGADAQPVIGLVWLHTGSQPIPNGHVYTLPFTASPTIVAGSWVNVALTPEQTLPAGRWCVVGMAVVCNDATAARLVFPGEAYERPGVIVQDVYGDQPTDDDFRMGRFGVFGEFEHNAPPSLDVLGDTAGAESAVVYLDLIKVR